tara:strand:- start:88 stop:567 length:480 start_codon:yes stop_codon:yes gene_type:complete
MRNNIHRDLSKGHAGENKVIELFAAMSIESESNTDRSKLSDYDILANIDGKIFTTEVKNDLYAARSGNIAIEVYNPKSDKPSGLSATKANLWCHITDGLYFTKVQTLKDFVKSTPPFKLISSGGDNNATLHLYKADFILSEVFVKLDISSRSQLEELLA